MLIRSSLLKKGRELIPSRQFHFPCQVIWNFGITVEVGGSIRLHQGLTGRKRRVLTSEIINQSIWILLLVVSQKLHAIKFDIHCDVRQTETGGDLRISM